MAVKFFGQFLIEQGEIDAAQLREALDFMEAENLSLGLFAVEKELLKPIDVHRIQLEQRQKDAAFEDVVLELGLLSKTKLEALVRDHEARRVRIGDALVRKGHLPADRLGELLERFKIDQEKYTTRDVELPSDLRAPKLASALVELLSKFTERLAEIQVKVGEAEKANGQALPEYCAAVVIHMDKGLEILLAGDEDFSKRLTAGMLGAPIEDVNSFLLDDGLGEFLNVLAGNAVAIFEKQGQRVPFDPPRLGGCASAAAGYVFPLLATHGKATLILSNAS